ncbi:hypothetical protein [Sphingobacterium sp.]|uniref:hypothetical protein n=1 Tax=Sphingobacterium sp. TaxID=341027 RepID=UPI0031E39CD9
MKIFKNNVVRIFGLFSLVLGVYFAVNAMGKTEIPVKKAGTQTVWYEVERISPTGGENPSNYEITTYTNTPPPTSTSPTSCRQDNTSGQHCHYALTFDDSLDKESVYGMSVSAAITALSATQAGESRNPANPE